jgi:sulfate adenylyltransferase
MSDDLPRLVLSGDDLVLLELALGGAVPGGIALADAGHAPQVVLTDAENTPLVIASVAKDGTLASLESVRPLALGAGPEARPAVRVAARDADAGGETAVVVTHPSALGDVDFADLVAWASPVDRSLGAVARALGNRLALAVPRWSPAGAVVLRPLVEAEVTDAATLLVSWGYGAVEVFEGEATASVGEGVVVFFTGLSGSGKSTIAKALADDLALTAGRRVTLLDGDEVRQMLSAGLGFDRASRDLNIRRIGYVASLVSEHGGLVIAAPIAPFDEVRQEVRARAEAIGDFVLVWVSTPLEVCEARDRKGLYAAARRGEVAEFTGISSPYEEPTDADLTIDASVVPVEEAVAIVRAELERRGHIRA